MDRAVYKRKHGLQRALYSRGELHNRHVYRRYRRPAVAIFRGFQFGTSPVSLPYAEQQHICRRRLAESYRIYPGTTAKHKRSGLAKMNKRNKIVVQIRSTLSLVLPSLWMMMLILVAISIQVHAGTRLLPPPITDGITCTNVRSCDEANRAFTVILRRRFPVGSHENALRSALVSQGFRPLPSSITTCLPRGRQPIIGKMVIDCPAWDPNWSPRNYLQYGWGRPPCGSELNVMWSVDASGRIAHIEGRYDYTCL